MSNEFTACCVMWALRKQAFYFLLFNSASVLNIKKITNLLHFTYYFKNLLHDILTEYF